MLHIEEDESRYALQVIGDLFDHFFVKTAAAAKRKAAWNAAKQTAAGKPPVK